MDSELFVEKILELKKLGGHPKFYNLLLEMAELHARKNHDYAENSDPLSNLRQCQDFGIKPTDGVRVRLTDKWSRFVQLAKKAPMVVTESLRDTALDMAIYLLLFIILHEEEITKTNETN